MAFPKTPLSSIVDVPCCLSMVAKVVILSAYRNFSNKERVHPSSQIVLIEEDAAMSAASNTETD